MNTTFLPRRARSARGLPDKVPPHAWFVTSAVFHYLGPSFAVLLFPAVGVLGVAWFRIASAAAILAPVSRPWRTASVAGGRSRLLLVALGCCLAAMNVCFYLALERLPMSLVAAMEFLGTIGVALYGLRSARNVFALVLACAGVLFLIDVRWETDLAGICWSALNSLLFVGYILLGHKASEGGSGEGIARLGSAMAIAFLLVTPLGLSQALRAFHSTDLVLAGIGVGICSSVIPYACDQMAMARMPRASFALMLTLLPVSATLIAAVVLVQVPGPKDLFGLALVMSGIALHKPAEVERRTQQ